MLSRGIFGGSFDPPHTAHLVIAENFIQNLGLDIVTWVPARVPPHKKMGELSDPKHRLAMVELAINDNNRFEVSDIEFSESQPPWTVFLLEYFRGKYPEDELHLLIGGDSLIEFTSWRDYRKLWGLAEIDVALRPGFDKTDADTEVLANVRIIDCPLVDISASRIREMVRAGKSIRYLVPDNVRKYILENDLYIAK